GSLHFPLPCRGSTRPTSRSRSIVTRRTRLLQPLRPSAHLFSSSLSRPPSVSREPLPAWLPPTSSPRSAYPDGPPALSDVLERNGSRARRRSSATPRSSASVRTSPTRSSFSTSALIFSS